MKKSLLLILSLVLSFALILFSSCGDTEETSSQQPNQETSSVSTPETSRESEQSPSSSSVPEETSGDVTESVPETTEDNSETESTSVVDTGTQTETQTDESSETEEPTETGSVRPEPQFSSRNVENKTWDGKTLNILTVRYGATVEDPYTQVELNPAQWGESMVTAVADMKAKAKELYGVDLVYVQAQNNQSMVNDLNLAISASDVSYEIAYPRAFEVFKLANGMVYDMADREYIDFNNTYFSEEAYRMFTLAGHTLFADGDFNFMNEELSYFLLYNRDMLQNAVGFDSIYQNVKDGTWTYDKMVSLARNVSKDNGNGEPDDEDTYGFGTKSFTRLYRHFGVYGVNVNEDSQLYEVTENQDMNLINKVIEKILELKSSTSWARGSWGGEWGAHLDESFAAGRILFYTDVSAKINNDMMGVEFSMGVLPFPKLDAEQDKYYTYIPGGAQPIFLCVPKCTSDRAMSDYFVDVLSWMGQDYLSEAYYEHKMSAFNMETIDEDLDILQNYVWNNIMLDVASLCNGWTTFFGSVEEDSVKDGVNNFAQPFANRLEDVLDQLDFINQYWSEYSDD